MKKKKIRIYQDKIEKSEIRVRRLVALIIDWYLTSVFSAIPITFFLRKSNSLQTSMFDFSSYDYPTSLFLVFFNIVVFIIYYIIIPVYIWKGQTLGKKICKIKVVQENLEDINLVSLLKRELIGQTFVEGGIVNSSSSLRQLLPICGYVSILKYVQYLAYALTLVSIIYACTQPFMQSFHDKIAHTVVIKQR